MGRPQSKPKPMNPEEKLQIAEEAVLSVRGVAPAVLDMREVTVITDYFVICSGTSNVHMRALADRVLERFEAQGVRPFGKEGYQDAEWILLDYGDVVVHIFSEEARDFYALERLWNDAPRRDLEPEEVSGEPGADES